jgi:hypothetical protein
MPVLWQISLEASRVSQASLVFGIVDLILLPLDLVPKIVSNDDFQAEILQTAGDNEGKAQAAKGSDMRRRSRLMLASVLLG